MKKMIQSLLVATTVLASVHASAGSITDFLFGSTAEHNGGYNDSDYQQVRAQLNQIQKNIGNIQGELTGILVNPVTMNIDGIMFTDQYTKISCTVERKRLIYPAAEGTKEFDDNGCTKPAVGAYKTISNYSVENARNAVIGLMDVLGQAQVRDQMNKKMLELRHSFTEMVVKDGVVVNQEARSYGSPAMITIPVPKAAGDSTFRYAAVFHGMVNTLIINLQMGTSREGIVEYYQLSEFSLLGTNKELPLGSGVVQ